MNRFRTSGAAVACLVLALALGGCHSRSARKKALEEAPAPAPAPAVTSTKPAPVVRRAPAAAPASTHGSKRTSLRYGRPGFAVYEAEGESGRLWVFRDGSDALQEFLETGEPAKRITRIGAGPDGRSLMSADGETIDSYLASTVYAWPGFFVDMLDGRLWVFREGSEALAAYREVGEPAKRLTRIAAGPDDLTLVGPDAETLDEYTAKRVFGRPGFATVLIDGRLWVFRNPSDELVQFATVGEPAKRITRIAAGPRDLTLVGPDAETLDDYMAEAVFGRPGFATYLIDGRLWVFRTPSPELDEFERVGEPAKRVTRVGQGPRDLTLVGPDGETLDAYLAAYGG